METDDSILVRADLDNKSVTVRPAGGHFETLPRSRGLGAISMLSLVPQKSGVEYLPNGGSYGDKGEQLIKSGLDALLQNGRCRRAFEIVGLQTINQTVEKGLVIGPATLLNNPANNGMVGIVEGARQAYNNEFGTSSAQGATIRNIPGQPNPFASSRDQRPRMFFATSAFNDGASSLREAMVHEFIHAGGQGKRRGWRPWGHDLSGYEWYDFLQESCK